MAKTLKEILDPFHNCKVSQISDHQAPSLFRWMQGEAERQKIDVPACYLMHSNVPNAGAGTAIINGKKVPALCLTEGAFSNAYMHVRGPITEQMKATVAHEMSHLADMAHGRDGLMLRKLPMFALPFVTLAAYEIYTYMQTNETSLNEASEEVKKKNALSFDNPIAYFQADAHEWGRRLAAAGLGLISGIAIARHMSLSSEFRADRASVVACCNNAELVIEDLRRTEEKMYKIISPMAEKWVSEMGKRNFLDNLSQIFEGIQQQFSVYAHHAHPSFAERAAAMREFAKSKMIPPHLPH